MIKATNKIRDLHLDVTKYTVKKIYLLRAYAFPY